MKNPWMITVCQLRLDVLACPVSVTGVSIFRQRYLVHSLILRTRLVVGVLSSPLHLVLSLVRPGWLSVPLFIGLF